MREWLREARQERGLTMKQIGEQLDISESYYSMIESGTRQKDMDLTLVSRLSSVLGISVQEITDHESRPMPEPETQ